MFKSKKRVIIFIILFVIIGIALSVSILGLFAPKTQQVSYSGNTPVVVEDVAAKNLLKITSDDIVLGKLDAPVTIITYDSFTCSHCAAFYNSTFPFINKEYIEKGIVKFVHRDFPLDAPSLTASKMVKCYAKSNTPEKTYNLMTALYKSQGEWINGNIEANLNKIFEIAGANITEIASCIKAPDVESKILEARLQANKTLKVNGTPTIFVNDVRSSKGYGVQAIVSEVEAALSK